MRPFENKFQRDFEVASIRDDENKIAALSKNYDFADRRKPVSSPLLRWFLNTFSPQKETCFLAGRMAVLSEKIKIRKKLQMDFEKRIKVSLQEDANLKTKVNELRFQYDSLQDLRIAFQKGQSKIIALMAD